MTQIISAILLVSGTLFICVAALGLLRMPELFLRMHSFTKAGTLGLGLVLLGLAAHFQELEITIRSIATIGFIVLTAPVSAHVISRAAYSTGVKLWNGTIIDEFKDSATKP